MIPHEYKPTDPTCVLSLDLLDVRKYDTVFRVMDHSDYNNHGNIVNASLTSCNYGRPCVSLGGLNGYIDCGDSSSLSITDGGAFSLGVWVITPDATPGTNKQIINQLGGSGSIAGFIIMSATGMIHTWLDGTAFNSGKIFTENTWVHVAITYDLTNLNFYINGKLTETKVTTVNKGSTGNLLIGSIVLGSASAAYFNGAFGDVRIYNRSLSVNEINQYFNETRYLYGI